MLTIKTMAEMAPVGFAAPVGCKPKRRRALMCSTTGGSQSSAGGGQTNSGAWQGRRRRAGRRARWHRVAPDEVRATPRNTLEAKWSGKVLARSAEYKVRA